MSKRLIAFLAVACGIAVSNIYYAQPLAALIAKKLSATDPQMGAALMASQIGYALGMLLLVPLGDGRERRRLLVVTSSASCVSLVLVAISPNFQALFAASLLVGFTSSLPQMLIPYAMGLTPEKDRGRVVGTLMGGLLAGVLLSRTVSGLVAGVLGFRVMFLFAAALMAALTIALRLVLPEQAPAAPKTFMEIMRSLGTLLREQPILRRHSLVGALGFASFSAFWSTLAFHLAKYGYDAKIAGAFGLVGASGVLAAPIVGRLTEKITATKINACALLIAALSFALLYESGSSLALLAIGVVLLDVGVQANLLTNQTVIYSLAPDLRSRLNAVYMVSYFVGGALGTVVASLAWTKYGWAGVCIFGASTSLLGALRVAKSAVERTQKGSPSST